jgi:hypothetical protein
MVERQELRLALARAGGYLFGALYSFAGFMAVIHLKRNGLGTWSFLVGMPAVLAMIPYVVERRPRAYTAFAGPLFALVVSSAALWLIGQEAGLCLLVIVAPLIVLACLIAIVMRSLDLGHVSHALRRKGVLLLCLLLPSAGAVAEDRWLASPSSVRVTRSVTVRRDAATVFAGVVEVERLTDAELPRSWLNALGVPRPVLATVDRRAVGGLRVGHFEGGLRFLERITAYEPARRLRLAVTADLTSMAPDDLNVHVFDAGLFSVDDVEYRVEPVAGGTRLELSSRYTIRSTVSVYGNLWARLLMSSFEERLLAALHARFENRAAPAAGEVASR